MHLTSFTGNVVQKYGNGSWKKYQNQKQQQVEDSSPVPPWIPDNNKMEMTLHYKHSFSNTPIKIGKTRRQERIIIYHHLTLPTPYKRYSSHKDPYTYRLQKTFNSLNVCISYPPDVVTEDPKWYLNDRSRTSEEIRRALYKQKWQSGKCTKHP